MGAYVKVRTARIYQVVDTKTDEVLFESEEYKAAKDKRDALVLPPQCACTNTNIPCKARSVPPSDKCAFCATECGQVEDAGPDRSDDDPEPPGWEDMGLE